MSKVKSDEELGIVRYTNKNLANVMAHGLIPGLPEHVKVTEFVMIPLNPEIIKQDEKDIFE